MNAVTRRRAWAIVAALGVSALTERALALEPAKELDDVSRAIQTGDFATAVQRLQLHAADWALDRGVRTDLAIMQFAAWMFDKAEQSLGCVVRNERRVTSGGNPDFGTEYNEAWYRLAQLRAGQVPDE